MRQSVKLVLLALLIGVVVAIGAYLTAPSQNVIYPPTPQPLPVGIVPPGVVTPVDSPFSPICGLDCVR